jgi:TonB-linked SusC/RagA family outer membrane protein
MKLDTMINNLFTIAPWKRAVLVVSVLLLSLYSSQAQDKLAQDSILVKGVIVSGTNTPLSNVTISIEGSRQMPVVTNEAGEFSIKSSVGNNWLIISPVSDYKVRRVFLNSRTQLKVYLTDNDLAAGDDPLKILSQKFPRKDLVASYFDMNTNNTNKTPAISIDEYMQGKVSGMNIIRREGAPGTGAIGFIRGINSINANNQPLYVVDGIPMENPGIFKTNLDGFSYDPLSAVNMLDISSVIVVKDPTITSVYGSKASNGLVFVETLNPSAIQTSIDVDLRTGYSLAPSNLIPQLNASQHKTLVNEVLLSSGMYEENIKLNYPNLFLAPKDPRYIDYQHDTNWQDKIFADAAFTNVNLRVKGGDAIARYGLSFGYLTSKGVIKSTSYDSYNLRFVGLLNIFKWLRMNAGVSLNYNSSNMKESAKAKETNPILSALGKSPMLNPYQYDMNGNMITSLTEVDELGVSNPLAIVNNFKANNSNYHFLATMGFEGELSKDLLLISNFSLTYNGLFEKIFKPNHGMSRYYNLEAYNVATRTNDYLLSFYNNTYVSYKKVFNKVHTIASNTGLNVMTNKYQLDWGLTMNASENDKYNELTDGTDILRQIGGANRIWNSVSIYESLNYAFKDKYLVSASVSFDGSSRVGQNAIHTLKIGSNPFGLFYGGGLGWRLSSEPILNRLSWLNDFKLRLSYGKTGNDDVGESNGSVYYAGVKYRGTVGLYPAITPNPNLSYETVSQLNGGTDIALFGDRVKITADVFKSTINDMLVLTPISHETGYSYRLENGGKMENVGFDLNASLRIIDGRSFKWDIEANVSKVKNKVISLNGEKGINDITGGQTVTQVGSAANSFYGYVYEGVYATSAEAATANLMNEKFVKYSAGDAKFADISGPKGIPDGIINEDDKTTIGSSMPTLYGGLQNTFTYKKWSLNTQVNFVSGNKIFNYVRYQNEKMSGLENQSASVLNRWQYEGQKTDVTRALWNDAMGNAAFSSRWLEDGSYLRITNVSLSYKLPNKFLQFRNAEFYVSANNVLTISKYLGYDPEFSYSYSHAEQGVDYGQTPQARQFIIGVKLGL